MVRSRSLSSAAHALLIAMAEDGSVWHHGYGLCRRTGLKSGTLYPLLIRLSEQGLLEAQWMAPSANGRPPRHGYRLTAIGLTLVNDLVSHGSTNGPPQIMGAI